LKRVTSEGKKSLESCSLTSLVCIFFPLGLVSGGR